MLKGWKIPLLVLLISISVYYTQIKMQSYGRAKPVIIVGSGLAGLTSAYRLLDCNIPVLLLEKTDMIGGNSLKASSGINGCSTSTQKIAGVRDSVPLFVNDTVKSSGPLGNRKLQNLLVSESSGAIEWLKEEIGVKLDVVNQLGGHSTERTHRSDGIPPGFEIISKLKEKVLKHDKLFSLKLNARLVGIDVKNDSVKGVTYRDESTQKDEYVESSNVILATGGFGFSRELIKKFKPEYADLPTTNGAQTLGEGQLLIESIGGELIDMDQIQIHPTGFIKQDDRDSRWKFLAAESLRGIGGVLLNADKLERFVNELDTRDKVSFKIREQIGERAFLVLNDDMYDDFKFQIDFYTKMKLFENISAREKFGDIERAEKFVQSLKEYSTRAVDEFNRSHKRHVFGSDITIDTLLFISEITPVVHFTMGGIKIDENAQVSKKDGSVIDGLYAAGEVSGGVHGKNRLGGNSLLECVVFGTRAADSIKL